MALRSQPAYRWVPLGYPLEEEMGRKSQVESDTASPQSSPILSAAREGWGTTFRYAVLLMVGRVVPSALAVGVLWFVKWWFGGGMP
jgi:hypothetical protein